MAKKPSDPQPGSAPRAFTDSKRVKELIDLMTHNGLTEIELVEDKSRILLRRGSLAPASQASPPPIPMTHSPAPAPSAPALAAPKPQEDNLLAIKSPMVGTFYAAPSPDAPAYVSVGSIIDEKSVVCVIEAMKHFNDIYAETRGTIAKVLVSNGQVVEFGQPLFLVKPN